MTNQLPLNVISPKALEKQLKIVESRIAVLQSEMTELEKIKNACLVLMGTPEEATTADASLAARTKKKKTTAEEEASEAAESSAEAFAQGSEDSPAESTATH